MEYDVFFSISRTPVDGRMPSEAEMFSSFLREARAADEAGYGVCWVAESHLSTEVQKGNARPVVPHWQGEIGLNTNLPLLAQWLFDRTKRIEVGSAVTNIVAMGGPIAAAEKVASMLALHGLDPQESRRLHLGFSAGRFDFMNEATGIVPRSELERAAWPALKNRIFREATEVFLRLLDGETFSSDDVTPPVLRQSDVWVDVTCAACGHRWQVPFAVRERARCSACGAADTTWNDTLWKRIVAASGQEGDAVSFERRWVFERIKLVPEQWRRDLLQLIIGSHDPEVQILANERLPVQVFNLSITRPEVIDATHARMTAHYHPSGGPWKRSYMPRTTFVFLDPDPSHDRETAQRVARERARKALTAYWTALQGTIDPGRIEQAADNALVGGPAEVAEQIRARFHPEDRLMLWFDFFEHDAGRVCEDIAAFQQAVVPLVEGA